MAACIGCLKPLDPQELPCRRCGRWTLSDGSPIGAVTKSKVATLDTVTASAIARLVTGQFWDKTFGGGLVPSSCI